MKKNMGTSTKEGSNKTPSNTASTNEKTKKEIRLHAEAKEFVPHKPVLKATAPEFHPHPEEQPKKVVSAWGSKANEAVLRAAPPPQQQQQQQHQNRNKNNNRRNNDKNNRDNRHGKKGGRRNQNKNRESNFRSIAGVELYKLGDGNTDEEKGIHRMDASALLALRLLYLDAAPLTDFNPPEYALWDSPTRVQDIRSVSLMGSNAAAKADNNNGGNKSASGGNNASDAPTEEPVIAPLVVNEETRWKAKIFSSKDPKKAEETEEDSTEDILKKALLILNKLSLTKFDKLSQKFIDSGIFTTEESLKGAISLIVDKAQLEPHFSSMYAQLCQKLSLYDKQSKKFRKMLLTRCQEEFEQDLASKIAEACKVAESPDDTEEMKAQLLEYHTNLCRKKYLGHMRFIGELYKNDLISIRIMIFCLPFLLDADSSDAVDEEKIECFAKLMTTIGHSLELQSKALENVGKKDSMEKLLKCWKDVEDLLKGKKISSRVKFMLKDLMDLKKNGWKVRRKVETAKTLNEIHREVAKEERKAKRSNSAVNLKALGESSMSRSSSRNSMKVTQVDEDGFMKVVNSKSSSSNLMKRNLSMTNLSRSVSDSLPNIPDKGNRFMKRNSTIGDSAITKKQSDVIKTAKPPSPPPKEDKKVVLKTPEQCGKLVKSILKEYFFTNDIKDALLSLEELLGPVDDEKYKDRIIALLESSILQVMEMKKEDVEKLIKLIETYAAQNEDGSKKKEYITQSLHMPLELLMDIVIDAPLASKHLSAIVSSFIKSDLVKFEFFLSAPEYFLMDSNLAAKFAKDVLMLLEISDDEKKKSCFDVIEKLMTEDEKSEFGNVNAFVYGKE